MGSAEQYGGPTEADALAAWEDVVRLFTRDVQAVFRHLDMSGDVLALILPTIDCPEFRAIFTWRFLTLVPRCECSNGHSCLEWPCHTLLLSMRESPHLRRGCRRCTGLKNTSLPYWQGAWRVPILAVRCRECERRPLSTGSDLTRACVSGHSSVDWACDLTRASHVARSGRSLSTRRAPPPSSATSSWCVMRWESTPSTGDHAGQATCSSRSPSPTVSKGLLYVTFTAVVV